MGFYFWNGALVGHEFTSSFDTDAADFDAAKVTQINKAEATESEVTARSRGHPRTPTSIR